jgi:hypothetical protein
MKFEELMPPVSQDHIFNIGNSFYIEDAKNCINSLVPTLSRKELKALFNNKLQMSQPKFDKNQFIQSVCELSAASHFFQCFPDGFKYEKNICNSTDVDFSFISNGLTLNVEVKCFINRDIDQNKTPIIITGAQYTTETYKEFEEKLPDSFQLVRSRRMSINKFIEESIKKFHVAHDKEFNILMICCYDYQDYMDTMYCLAGINGLMRENSFFPENIDVSRDIELTKHKNIDVIVVNNMADNHYFLHQESTSYFINPWSYKNSLTMGLLLNHARERTNDYDLFTIKSSLNYMNDVYLSYCSSNKTNSLNFFVSLPPFINELRQKGGYYFSNREII